MARTKLDRKTSELGKLVFRLRQDIDVARIIGLNVRGLRKLDVGRVFFGYSQVAAVESIAIGICKIYEKVSPPFDPNCIEAVLIRLEKYSLSPLQAKAIERFGRKYGNVLACKDPHDFLRKTLSDFRAQHAPALKSLRTFRNKAAAHSEFGFKRVSLPSHNEFEALFAFAEDFYRLVHDSVNGVGPALMSSTVGSSLHKVIIRLGVTKAAYHFAK